MVNVQYKISYTTQPNTPCHVNVQEMNGYDFVEKFDCSKEELDEQIKRLQIKYKNSQVCHHVL